MSDTDMNQNSNINSILFTKTKLFSGKTLVGYIGFKRLVDEHLGSGKIIFTDEY